MAKAEETIEGFVDDLNQVLHSAKTKAEGWLGQRQQISKTLEGIRDTASNLLEQLGTAASTARASASQAVRTATAGTRRRRRRRKAGRPRATAAPTASAPVAGKKKRTMSPEARERIAAAQRARWAKVKAGQKKK